MIAAQEKDSNAAIGQARELAIEEQADRGVLPVAVEHISGDHREGDLLLQRARHEVLESVPARAGETSCDIAVLLREPKERASEMQVGGVKELEAHRADVRPKRERRGGEVAQGAINAVDNTALSSEPRSGMRPLTELDRPGVPAANGHAIAQRTADSSDDRPGRERGGDARQTLAARPVAEGGAHAA